MSSRPFVRWTIGRVHPCGWEVLLHSLDIFPRLYPEFDMIVCHNNLEIDELKTLSTANVVLHEQKQDQLPYPVGTTGWKLLPPRLRLDAHELWLDNDVVLCNRLPAIDA